MNNDCSGVDSDTHAIADQLAGRLRGWCNPASRCNSGLQSSFNGARSTQVAASSRPGASRQRHLCPQRARRADLPSAHHHAPAVACKAGNYFVGRFLMRQGRQTSLLTTTGFGRRNKKAPAVTSCRGFPKRVKGTASEQGYIIPLSHSLPAIPSAHCANSHKDRQQSAQCAIRRALGFVRDGARLGESAGSRQEPITQCDGLAPKGRADK